MHSVFHEVGMHANLGRTIEQIGQPRFWKQLILLLHRWLPFDNALAAFYPLSGTPLVQEEHDATPQAGAAAMALYLSGLYQLDPFYLACQDAVGSGLYRLDEVAPDQFHQSEYYISWFQANVLNDEVQFILQLPGQGALTLSLGRAHAFDAEQYGVLAMLCPWVLALMQQHWQAARKPVQGQDEPVAVQVRDALSQFGAGVLSERELEIARLILRGFSSKAMAERLAISPETVKVHRRHLYTKLDISSQPELFSLFLQSLGHDPQNP
ncbi:LuxR C-terminal-related transcriptional regulator [Pseudomonas sp. NPDC089752]|uniref:helix-turn-helix transcriptional regulator n=1 Tax=Pseudomonas sp. NPDC089752 TaxID=3364472 RepID=UPI003807072E